MPKFAIKWSLNRLALPQAPEERVKLQLKLLEMIKADMAAGSMKDWGAFPGEGCGYVISEVASAEELQANLLKYAYGVIFEVKPVVGIDQTIENIKKVATAMQK